jgi:hypothetical protein
MVLGVGVEDALHVEQKKFIAVNGLSPEKRFINFK